MAIEPNLKERLRSDRAEALITTAEEAAMLINIFVGFYGLVVTQHLRSRQKPEEQ